MSRSGLREFFQTVWKNTRGYVCIASMDKDAIRMRRVMFPWPAGQENIINHVLTENGTQHEVFFSPAIYQTNTSFKRDNVKGSWVCWVDFDGNAPASWNTRHAPEDLAPSMRVRTSGPSNQHCYWVLEEFINDTPQLELRNRQLAYQLNADTSGWDANQLLRPPYTTNYGYSKDRKRAYDVRVEEQSEKTYPTSFIQVTEDFRTVIYDKLDLAKIPTIGQALARGRWSDKFLSSFFGPSVEVGKRSDAYMAFAYQAAEAGLDDSGIFAIISDLDERWGLYFKRSDKLRRYADLIERARRKVPYGDIPDFARLFGVEGEAPKVVYSYREFMDTFVEMAWVYKEFLTENGYGILAGDPGVGKTGIALRMALCLSTGKDFLQWQNTTKTPLRVLFLSLEMVHAGLQLFLSATESTRSLDDNVLIESNLMLAPLASTLPLDTKDGREALQSLLDQYKPNVLIVDSLSKSTYKSLSDEDTARAFNDYTSRLRKQNEITLVFVHHSRKSQSQDKRDSLNSLYGSRFLSAEVDFLLSFFKTKSKGYIEVECSKIRYGPEPDPFIVERGHDLSFDIQDLDGAENFTERMLKGHDRHQNHSRGRRQGSSTESFGLGFAGSDRHGDKR